MDQIKDILKYHSQLLILSLNPYVQVKFYFPNIFFLFLALKVY